MTAKPHTHVRKVVEKQRCVVTTSTIPRFPISSSHTHTHDISLCSFKKAQLPPATRGAYQLLPHLPYCYQPGLVHTYTLSAPFCQTHPHSFYLCLWLSLSHTRAQTGEWMLWGLIGVLRGLAATSQTQIPVLRPQRQTYVTRVLMNTALCSQRRSL